jgi:hypothetical protein
MSVLAAALVFCLVIFEVLEDEVPSAVSYILLDVLDLLNQEELVLLRQVIQVDFVRQVDNIIHGSLGR